MDVPLKSAEAEMDWEEILPFYAKVFFLNALVLEFQTPSFYEEKLSG